MEEAEYCAGCLRCGDERDAMFWCAHCSEFVCNCCAKLHKTFQTPHAVLAKEQLSISSELLRLGRNCEIHRLQKIVFFCCQHDQLACDKCKSESHQTCTSIVSIEEAAENVRNGTVLSDLERRIDNLSQRIGGILKYNKNLIGHDEYDKTEIKNKVRDVKQQLVLHFEELENQLFNDIDKMFPNYVQSESLDLKNLKTTLKTVDGWKQDLKYLTENTSEIHLFKVIKFLDKEVHTQASEVAKCKTNKQVITFEPSETILSYRTVFQSLGTLTIRPLSNPTTLNPEKIRCTNCKYNN